MFIPVSIIIPVCPAHNRDSILGACLDSIIQDTYPKDKIELVIIGDGCSIKEDFLRSGVKTIAYNFKNKVGTGITRNKGAELARAEFLVFVDADCMVKEGWLDNLVSGFGSEDVAGCAGKIIEISGNSGDIKNRIYGQEYLRLWHIFYLPFAGLGNIVLKRKILEEIGYLDENITARQYYLDDIDLSWRIYLRGYRIEYAEGAAVFHKGVINMRNLFLYGMGTRMLVNKYRKLNICPLYFGFLTKIKGFPQLIRNLVIALGYLCAFIKEKIFFSRRHGCVELTGEFLQPVNLIKPLKVSFNSRSLVKPNYMIWWRAESGVRIVDLKERKNYHLEDMSGRIWQLLMDNKSREVIVDELTAGYDTSQNQIAGDLEEFMADLCQDGILIDQRG